MNRIIYVVIFAILLIGSSTYVLQEAEAINKIIGYVSKAKQDALEAELKLANQTAIGNQTATQIKEEDDTTNRSDDIDKEQMEVVEVIRKTFGLGVEEIKKQYTKVVGIQLSRTCLEMEKNNITSNCSTYKDLMQFDNTIPDVSGHITYTDGYWHREATAFKFKHCNYYLDKYPVIIVIDPDGCWQRYTGIRMITIQALDPSKMVFKLKLDRSIADDLRDLQDDERSIFEERDEAEREIDRLEDEIDDYESRIRNLEDDIDRPICKADVTNREGCNSSLQSRNFDFQLRFAITGLVDREADLKAEELNLINQTNYLNSTRFERDILKTSFGSSLMIDGKSAMGVGRYVEECRNATIGAGLDLLVDTLNYLLFDCTEESTNFNSIQETLVVQTPLLVSDFTEWKYQQWLAEAKERCKQKC